MAKGVVRATIDDAVPWIYTPEQAAEIIAGYLPHERDARAKGIPVLGSGRVFPFADADVSYKPSEVTFPEHFVWLGAMDLGGSGEGHPTAAVKCCWDRDTDSMYVTQAYAKSGATPLVHAGALRPWGAWLPWSWPHDGLRHDMKSGERIAKIYTDYGLKMHGERATFPDGSNGVEAGILELYDAMQTGRLKVAEHLNAWFDEFRLYHRVDGKIYKQFDDLMDATRYAWMMRRIGVQKGGRKRPADRGSDYNFDGGWMG